MVALTAVGHQLKIVLVVLQVYVGCSKQLLPPFSFLACSWQQAHRMAFCPGQLTVCLCTYIILHRDWG